MAVFSERNDTPFVTKSPVKTSRIQGSYSKSLHSFMSNNIITVKIDSSGTPHITSKENKNGK